MTVSLNYRGDLPIENPDELNPLVKRWFLCGSRVTCDPPVENTDRDIMVLAKDAVEFATKAVDAGFVMGGSMEPQDCAAAFRYVSMRRGSDNVIFTEDEEFFKRFYAATSASKKLNLLKKDDRVMLFQAVLYGNAC